MSGTSPAGWYTDPAGSPGRIRYFDGRGWTDRVRDIGTAPGGAVPTTAAPQTGNANPFQTTPRAPVLSGAAAAKGSAGLPFGVAAGTTQSLLLDSARTWRPRQRPTSAEPGWYPDPGRSRKLRFYDGDGWTARIQVPLATQMRSLPRAAVAARAKLLEVADAQAARSDAGRTWRRVTVRVEQPQSLHAVARGKSGRVGGMLSMALVIVAFTMLSFAGWQQYGADAWQQHHQEQLRHTLAEEFADQGGDSGTDFTVSADNPAPVDVPRPQLSTDPTHPSGRPTTPTFGDRPADIPNFPPAGWTAPAGRTVRNLDGYDLGDPVGRIIIPRMNLDEVMVAGIGANELAKGPGVARYAMMPGSPGNAVIAGHRTGWGEPFHDLDRLRYGDQIIIEVPGQARVVYEVRARVVVDPTDTRPVSQTEGVRLTLSTCTPLHVNTHRMIIEAEMVEGPWLDRAVNRHEFRTIP